MDMSSQYCIRKVAVDPDRKNSSIDIDSLS